MKYILRQTNKNGTWYAVMIFIGWNMYTRTQNTARWAAKSFSTPHYSQFGWMKFIFESCFESLRGIWVASSEGILRLYLEPWNLSLLLIRCILLEKKENRVESDNFQVSRYNLEIPSDDATRIPLSDSKHPSKGNFIQPNWL